MTWKSVAQGLTPRALWLPGEVSGGVVTDESANSYDATNNGGTASTSGGPGTGLTSFMAFDGTNDYLSLTTLVGWGFLNATIGIWIRSATTDQDAIMGVFNTGSNTAFHILNNQDHTGVNDPGRFHFFVRNDGSGAADVNGGPSADTVLYDGAWHFLVLRFDLDAATPTVTVRIDKSAVAFSYTTQSQMAAIANFGFPVTLGARNVRGTIDLFSLIDVAGLVLFDTNLSDGDADSLYDAAIPPPVDSDNTGQTADGHADAPVAVLAESFSVFPEVADGHADAPLATLLITAGPFPAAPTGVTAVAQSDDEILVSWNAVVGATAYDVERDSVIVAEKTALLSFSDTGLDASTEYEYRVRAARTP